MAVLIYFLCWLISLILFLPKISGGAKSVTASMVSKIGRFLVRLLLVNSNMLAFSLNYYYCYYCHYHHHEHNHYHYPYCYYLHKLCTDAIHAQFEMFANFIEIMLIC